MEWTRFQKYARRMREFIQYSFPDPPSPETFSAIQLCTINEPLFPNLKTLKLTGIQGRLIPFIPLFFSPGITSITLGFKSNLPDAMIASAITTLSTLCSNLQDITLFNLPRSPVITAAVSGRLLIANRNTLQGFRADSALTEEASEVLYKLPNLRCLSVVTERETRLPSALLPSLTYLSIRCEDEDGWPRLFHGATLGKLEHVNFHLQSKQVGDFLGAFERAALSLSVRNTLSKFYIFAQHSWNPNYSSLLPFTQLVNLEIEIPCDDGCPSRVDDDIIISLSRAMPKLEILALGDPPCGQSTTGITTKGLLALAHRCPKLSSLCVHLRVASLGKPPGIPGMVPGAGPATPWKDCALAELIVGETPVPEGSATMIALTLLRIFPRLGSIIFRDGGWEEVENVINRSRETADCSGKQHPLTTP